MIDMFSIGIAIVVLLIAIIIYKTVKMYSNVSKLQVEGVEKIINNILEYSNLPEGFDAPNNDEESNTPYLVKDKTSDTFHRKGVLNTVSEYAEAIGYTPEELEDEK